MTRVETATPRLAPAVPGEPERDSPPASFFLRLIQYAFVLSRHPVPDYPDERRFTRRLGIGKRLMHIPLPVADGNRLDPFGNVRRAPSQTFQPPETFFPFYRLIFLLSWLAVSSLCASRLRLDRPHTHPKKPAHQRQPPDNYGHRPTGFYR